MASRTPPWLMALLGLLPLAVPAAQAAPAALVGLQESAEDLEAFQTNLHRRIARHPYFKKIDLQFVWDHDGFAVLVQKPAKMEAGYVGKVAKLRVAESMVMNSRFKDGLAQDWEIGLRSTAPRLTIIVLASPGDMDNYFQVLFKAKAGARTAYYNPSERVLVLYEQPFGRSQRRADMLRLHERHERALQIAHGYGANSLALPGPYWFHQGLANEISGNNDRELSKAGVGKASEWAYHRICAAIQDPQARPVQLLPLPLLFRQTDYWSVGIACRERATAARVQPVGNGWYNHAFQATAGALFRYLTFDAPEDLRARMKSFSEAAMKNRLQNSPFEKHFEGVDWGRVERDFWTHVWRTHKDQAGDEPVDEAALATFLRDLGGTPGEAPVAADASFAPASLLAGIHDPEAVLALAIAQVRRGDPEAAAARLQATLETFPTGRARERLERELLRVRSWMEERDRFFAHLVESGKKLTLERPEGRLVATVARVEKGKLILASSNRGLDAIEIASLDPAQLVRRMTEKRSGFEATWAVAYPVVLDPDAKPRRYLRGDEPERVALAEDVKNDYPRRTRALEAARHLLVLGSAPEDGVESAAERVTHLRDLVGLRKDVAFVQELAPLLRHSAAFELTRDFDGKELSQVLNGKVEDKGDGSVHLIYDFESPDQLLDWPLDEYRADLHKRWPAPQVSQSYLEVRKGKLEGLGEVSRTHLLVFEGPQAVIWKIRVSTGGAYTPQKPDAVRVGLCSNEEGHYAASYGGLELEVLTAESEYVFQPPPRFTYLLDSEYVRELRLEAGGRLTVHSDGQEANSTTCPVELAGHPQIFLHSDYLVEIDQIELFGTVTTASRAALRERWVQARLQELGLGE